MSEEKPSVDLGAVSAVAVDKPAEADVLDDEDMSSLEELEIIEGEKKDMEDSIPDSVGKKMKNPPTIIIDKPKKRSPVKMKKPAILTKNTDEKKDDDGLLSPVWATAKKKKKGKKKKGVKPLQRHSAYFGQGKKGKFAGTTMVLGRLKQMAKESQAEFSVVGRGMAGLEEMKEILDDRKVWYGLLKVQIGSGNFMRTKQIFVNFLGEKCTAMKRGRAVRLRPFAEKALGYSHASVTFHSQEDCTYEGFWIQVGNIFATDHLNVKKKGWSWEKAKIEYEKRMAKKKKEIEVAKLNAPIIKPKKKPNRVAEILSILREDMGWVNWVLFKPMKKKLVLFNPHSYGDGSIYRMRLLLQKEAQDRVLYGLIRMAFGVRPYRRTHYVMFHWVGEKTKIMQRGKWNALVDPMGAMLCPFNITVQITRLEDMTVEDIILRVKKNVVVDGLQDEGKDIEEVLLKQFKDALEEEERKNKAKKKVLKADMEEKVEEKTEGAIAMTVTEIVTLVSNEKEETNWVLIAPPGHERVIERRQMRIQSCKSGR